MRRTSLTVPEVMLIAGTRVALGIGVGLLIADKLSPDARKGAAIALLGVGVISTFPLVTQVLGNRCGQDADSVEV